MKTGTFKYGFQGNLIFEENEEEETKQKIEEIFNKMLERYGNGKSLFYSDKDYTVFLMAPATFKSPAVFVYISI